MLAGGAVGKMRTTWLMAFALAVAAVPSNALEASDTMAAWRSAAPDERAKLVDALLKSAGHEGGASGVMKCVDAASEVSGHADLSIKLVVEACAKQAGEPV